MKNRMTRIRRPRALVLVSLLIMAGLCGPTYAQALKSDIDRDAQKQSAPSALPYTLKRGTNEFGFFGGTSLNNPTLIGTVTDARLTVVALRYGRVLGTSGEMAFEYTIDVVPVAIVSEPMFVARTTSTGSFTIEQTHEAVYGAGASPVGFKFNFRRRHRVQPFASTSGGILYFTKQVPLSGSSQFNFTFDFSGGVQILTRSRRAILLGYKYQHISNGGTAQFNPGLDANVVYAGFSVFK